uniref:Uncharacterized protein n=1 Tax=Aegilops tauschii subsp. strangulata TaxID=200361 RepID=A0A453K1F1_AEGTS
MLNSPLRPADLVCCSCCLNRCVPAVRRWRDRGGRGYAWLTEIPGQDQFPPMKGIHRLRPPSRGLDVGTLQLLPQCYFSKSDLCNSAVFTYVYSNLRQSCVYWTTCAKAIHTGQMVLKAWCRFRKLLS